MVQKVADRLKLSFSSSLLKKIMLLYVAIFVIPLLLLYGWLHHAASQRAQSDSGVQLVSALRNISDTMEEVFRSVNFVQSQMQASPEFSEAAFTMRPSEGVPTFAQYQLREDQNKRLYQFFINNSYLYSLKLWNPFGNVMFSNRIANTRKAIVNPTKVDQEDVTGIGTQQKSWHLQYDASLQEWLFVTYSRIFCASNPTLELYTKAAVGQDALTKRLRGYYPDDRVELFIQVPGMAHASVTSPQRESPAQALAESPLSGPSGFSTFTYSKATYLAAYYYSRYTNWYYVATAPLSFFNTSLAVMDQYFVYFLFILGAIFLTCTLLLLFQVILPMRSISRTMRIAEKGDLSVRIHTDRKDELGYIGHRLNVLLESIDSLIYENYESRLLKNDFELKYIQTQLKEHFIYNTLDSIHWIADKHHVPQISEIIFVLSRFFRLMLNQGSDTISIREAAEISRCYIALHNVRMDDAISARIDVEPELSGKPVLKYLFQPVLENAIVHGLAPNQGGHLHISFTRGEKGRIRYTVEDDGVGIAPQRLDEIRQAIRDNHAEEKFFALATLNRQLRLYFGEQYVYEIDSECGHGTRVMLEFPVKE